MNEIWANRLAAGTKQWNEVPASRRVAVKAVLAGRVENNAITVGQYEEITGEEYPAKA